MSFLNFYVTILCLNNISFSKCQSVYQYDILSCQLFPAKYSVAPSNIFKCATQNSKNDINHCLISSLFCFIEHNEGLTTHSCYAMWQPEKGSYKANIDALTVYEEVSNINKRENNIL